MTAPSILIVEDSGVVLLDIQKSLKLLGYEIAGTAATKDDAIKTAQETHPDLVLMDIRLGDTLGGIEAADYIRENLDIPIIFLTGYSDEETFQRAKITAPFGYILKPFDPKSLRTNIEMALHNHMLEKQLRASELRYRALFEQAHDAVFIIDINGNYISVNQRAADMLGYTIGEIQSMSVSDLTAETKETNHIKERLLNGEHIPMYERKFRKKGGEIIHAEVNVELIRDNLGNPLHIQSVIRDITDRKRSENIMLARLRLAQFAPFHSLEELLQKTLNEAEDLTGSCIGFFHFLLSDQKTLALQTWSTRTLAEYCMAEGKGKHYNIDQAGVWTDCIRERKAIIHNDYSKLPHRNGFPTGHAEVIRELVVPVIRGNKIVAILGVGNKPQNYNNNDVDAVSLIADLAWDIAESKHAEEALRSSEKQLKEAQRLAHIGNWSLDLQTNTLLWSDEIFRIFNLYPNEFAATYEAFLEAIHPEDREFVNNAYQESVKNKTPYNIEHRLLMPDNAIKFVVESCETFYDEHGIPLLSVGTVQDITERKLAENALRESEQRLRESQMIARLGNYRFDFRTNAWESSEILDEIFGIDDNYIKDVSSWAAIVHPDQREEMVSYFRESVIAGKQPFDKEYRIVRISDQQERWVHGIGKLEFDDTGELIHMIGTIQDITARKQMEIELRESEENYRLVVESVDEGIISMDLAGNITEVNPAFLKTMGFKKDELLEKNLLELLPLIKVDRKKVLARMKQIIQQREIGATELNLENRRGESIIVRIRYSTIMKGNIIQGISAVVEDITQRKQAENILKARTNELEALFSISTHLRSAQTAEEMLPVVLQQVRQVLNTDSNAVVLLNPNENCFTYALADGILASNTGTEFDIENSISGLVLKTHQAYVTENISADPQKAASVMGVSELGPAVLVPILSESEFIGVLSCAREKKRSATPFSNSEVQLLTAIGEMVGNAMRRARLFDQAISRLQHVQALHSVDMAISANLDINVTLEILLSHVTAQTNCDAANVLLMDSYSYTLEFAAGHGFRSKGIQSYKHRLGEGLPGWVAMNRKPMAISNLANSEKLIRKGILEEGFVSYFAAPLISKGSLLGVLEIFSRSIIPADDEQLDYLEALAIQAAIAIDNAKIFSQLQSSNLELSLAYDATIEGWSHALELRDMETEGHTLRVTDMTVELAKAMGLPEKDFIHLRHGALLHDIGKMGIPDKILLKPGSLDDEEWKIMKMHTVYAFEMLWPIDFLRPAIDIPHCHHEKWDGSGYPRGLKGDAIPLPARIFAVADVYDALTSDRPYRNAWSHERALEHICNESGKHFQPEIVEIFRKVIENNHR